MTIQTQAVLKVQNLTKIYNDKFTAVDNISFQVNKGDFMALLGPNGAGKSTALGIIASLTNKTSGNIEINGYDLDTQTVLAKKQLGFMPQEVNLNIFETPWDTLITQAGYFGIPANIAKPKATELLNRMDLFQHRFKPNGKLSGGMKRRLMVARALIHNPTLLILDEPTAGVDVELRNSLWTFIKQLNQQGLSIILTTHYLEEAESMCNKVALINHGKVHFNDTLHKLIRQCDKNQTYIIELQKEIQSEQSLPKHSDILLNVKKNSPLSLQLTVKAGTSMTQLFAELKAYPYEIIDIKLEHNRLENIFLNLNKNEQDPK